MATQLHPTAVVAPGAQIGQDCVIGPYCVIGPHAVLGDGCHLHSHVVVDGHTRIGPGGEIFPFACIGGRTQDLKFRGGDAFVEIGARTTLREYVTVHSATEAGGRTTVGDDCHILAYCHIAHNCVVGSRIIMSNSTHLAGHVTVEDGAVFGGMGGVHQFVRIGSLAMLGATGKAVQDIAPFCLADGNPAEPVTINRVGLQRNGRGEDAIQAVDQAYRILFRSNLLLEAAVARLQAELSQVPDVRHLIDFCLAKSARGLARPKGHKEP